MEEARTVFLYAYLFASSEGFVGVLGLSAGVD